MSSPLPVRRPPPRKSAPKTFWVGLCSFIAGVVITLAVVRLSGGFASFEKNVAASVATTPAPTPESIPLPTITRHDPPPQIDDSPVRVDASPAPVFEIPPGPPPDPKMLAQPVAAAATLVDLVDALKVTDLFHNSQNGHTTLLTNLEALQTAAKDMTSDNGSNPARTAQLNKKLTMLLDAAINRADTIAKRNSETDDARQSSALLRDTLRVLRGQ